MAEDIREQDLAAVNDYEWVRGLDAQGNPIKISKKDMMELILLNFPVVSMNSGGIVSSNQFKDIFCAHTDNTHDFNNPYLQSGVYGINKDADLAGINVPPEALQYGIMVHCRSFESALGGNPALQLYFPVLNNNRYFRIYWSGRWTEMKQI